MILGVSYFPFRQVSLAEYILVLRVYSLLLQMTCFIRASARPASTPRVTRTRSLGRDRLLVTFLNAFVGWWSVRLAVVFELNACVMLPLLYELNL
jgi:hypothetical protein